MMKSLYGNVTQLKNGWQTATFHRSLFGEHGSVKIIGGNSSNWWQFVDGNKVFHPLAPEMRTLTKVIYSAGL
jgi:hypothetical protein